MRKANPPHSLQRSALPWLALLFVALNTVRFWRAMGDDLASSYVGCRVLAAGHPEALYSYDPVNFAGIGTDSRLWTALARSGGYHGYLHPYVQTPLWAWSLAPLCRHLDWLPFEHLFLILSLASIAALLLLVVHVWTPALARPLPFSLLLLAVSLCEPFVYAMQLVQTHAMLLLLTVAGLVLAQRGRPGWAGLLVALAAAVKITPAVVLLYWLASHRWRAAGSLAAWSAALVLLTRVTAGPVLFHAFAIDLHRVSRVLLVSENNQSLAAWWMARFFPPDEVFDVNAWPLPKALRLVSSVLLLGTSLLAGWMDRARWVDRHETSAGAKGVPWGAGLLLVAMTVFAPIAWTHYFFVLAIPVAMLVQAAFGKGWGTIPAMAMLLALLIAAPLFRPLAPDVVHMDLADAALLHGVFFSAMLCIAAMPAMRVLAKR